jgi:hypothetical protein
MAITFPSIEPTARSFNAPRWQTKTQVSQSGVITRRLWGSRPSQAVLSFQFNNISDENVTAILDAHYQAKGATDTLILPSILFNGASPDLRAWLDGSATGAGLLWSFTEGSPPQVESISPGRSNVSLSLTAELRMS